MLVGDPHHRLFGEVIHDAVHGDAVAVVVVPISSADGGKNIHCRLHILHFAVRRVELVVDMHIAVIPGFERVRRVVICVGIVVAVIVGLQNEVGDPLIVRRPFARADMRVVIVVNDVQFALRAVVVRRVRAVRPFENGAPARCVGDHIVEGGLCRIVHIVRFDLLDRLVHRGAVIEDHAHHRGGSNVVLVRLLIGCDRLLPLIAHEDAAAQPLLVHAVQGRVGSGKAGNLIDQPLDVLIRIHAQELQIDGADGRVPPVARVGEYERGVRLRKIVVAGEDPVPFRRDRRERAARDLALLDIHFDQPAGDFVRDEADEVAVVRRAALREEIVEIESARNVHAVHRAVLMLVIAVRQLFEARQRGNFVPPYDCRRADQRRAQHDNCRQDDRRDFHPLGNSAFCLLFAHVSPFLPAGGAICTPPKNERSADKVCSVIRRKCSLCDRTCALYHERSENVNKNYDIS